MNTKELKELVLASFNAERSNNIAAGKQLITEDFKVTEMSLGNDGLQRLPSVWASGARDMIDEAYQYAKREYQFVHVVVDEPKQTVIVEFVETYPDPQTGQIYRTPQVAVCEIKDGKIYRTRHYNDPRVSFANITQTEIDQALS